MKHALGRLHVTLAPWRIPAMPTRIFPGHGIGIEAALELAHHVLYRQR